MTLALNALPTSSLSSSSAPTILTYLAVFILHSPRLAFCEYSFFYLDASQLLLLHVKCNQVFRLPEIIFLYLLLLKDRCEGDMTTCRNNRKLIEQSPLRYSCLENPMDGGAWQSAAHEVAKSWTRLSNFTFMHWRRKWQPTQVFLPGESQEWGSLVGCRPWGCTESDTTEATQQQQQPRGKLDSEILRLTPGHSAPKWQSWENSSY